MKLRANRSEYEVLARTALYLLQTTKKRAALKNEQQTTNNHQLLLSCFKKLLVNIIYIC